MRHQVDTAWRRDLRAHSAEYDRARLLSNRAEQRSPEGRMIARACAAVASQRSKRVILWLAAGLAGSVAANILQGLLYVALLKRIC
jgi:ferric-dicitrate binding protein FerR (iron transport regulator)